ncbi:MAG: hypothetical protein JNK15_11410 [Planctomycetes bacterium]|nr:hypothetical protein [Planctomycetota bacterium]
MSLNARIGTLAVAGLLLAPLWLPLLPFWCLTARRSRRDGIASGLATLTARQACTIAAMAEATLPSPPAGGWGVVARNVDRYLAAVRSPRRWRTLVLLTGLEYAPLLRLHRPLSRQDPMRRRTFVERHLATTHGLLAIPSLVRQLVRMGYYSDPHVADELGFLPMTKRSSTSRHERLATPVAHKEVG